jgi:hypothetical protein
LGAEEVKAAIAYREKMLKERREEEEEAKKKEKRAGKDKDTGAVDGTLSAQRSPMLSDEMADTGEASVGKNGKRPQFFKEMSTISRKLRTSALDINPLAPSSAFDETLKTKLAGAQESVREPSVAGKKHHSSSRQHSRNYGRRNDLVEDKEERADDADAENGLSGPSRQQTLMIGLLSGIGELRKGRRSLFQSESNPRFILLQREPFWYVPTTFSVSVQ